MVGKDTNGENCMVWGLFFQSALRGEGVLSAFLGAGDWVKKGSCHAAWSVLPLSSGCSSYSYGQGTAGSSCTCSYSYGQGPAIGPQTGERCWPLLPGLWRAIAPLMKLWCAEEVLPTAANLNLHRGWTSCVGWHSDKELLFGKCGEAKLIVSVSFGTRALRKGKSCPDSEASSCWLEHGDLLVMYGQCQDEFIHCTDSGPGTGTDQRYVPLDRTTCLFLSFV